jgi:hypothetical protein
MYEFGKEANQDFERKFLGPRANFAEYMDMDAEGNLDAAPDDVARWKSAHHLGDPVNPRGTTDDVAKAIAALEAQEESARQKTANEWQHRHEYKRQAPHQVEFSVDAETEIPPADSWVHERITKIHGGHQGGDQLQKDIAYLRTRLADGDDLEHFYEETNEMLNTNYQRAVELKLALAHVDTTT